MATSTDGSARLARTSLILLVAINLFNYIDRQVLAAVEPEIRAALLEGANDKDAKFKMGLLSTAFLLSYMILAPVFGALADRYARWKIVAFGVVLWSLASGASGLDWGTSAATAFVLLLLTRCFVGVGEAAYGPVAPAMIADLYPIEKRGSVLAWFYLAIPVGGALGYALGGIVKTQLDWRWAFYLVVPPGLLLGVLALNMPEPPARIKTAKEPIKLSTWNQYVALFRIPSYFCNTAGMTLMTFAIGGIAWWMPAYLQYRDAPPLGPIDRVTLFGIIVASSGLCATLAGGWAGDYFKRRFAGSYFIVSGLAMLLGFPMFLAFLFVPFPYAWIFVFLAVFCLFFNTGPTNTILANVTHPSVRASAFALNILVIHLFGDAVSPPIIGAIADRTNLHDGFLFVSGTMVASGLVWLWGARYLEADTMRAAANE